MTIMTEISTRDLDILIPARNEEWLPQTVADILKNKRGNTGILVGLDGYLCDIPDHPDVTIVHYAESIGQRAMQNRLARISTAKYVMKVDAHCAFDEGFDVKMLEAYKTCGDDVTMVPEMRNLHVFNWKCKACGIELYQGPDPITCRDEMCPSITWNADNVPDYKSSFEKVLVWKPRHGTHNTAYRFNKNLQFKYFPELRSKLPREGLQETMSLQGSCFMCSREKYFSLPLCDESWGSWGQQGSEVALKTWLSGGRVLCNVDTWYAHLFRTQQGFSFPYPLSGKSQHKAREICANLFLNDKWDKAIRPLSWLLEKFWFALKDVNDPDAKWTLEDIKKLKHEPTKGIIFYTDNRLTLKIAGAVQKQLRRIGLPIVSSSLKPMSFGQNVVVAGERGYHTYFRQIIAALEKSDADIVYFCEHDVLYNPSHFEFTPPNKDTFYYNQNVWRLRYPENFAVTWDCHQVAALVCYRELALDWYRKKLIEYENAPLKTDNKNRQLGDREWDRKFEPDGKVENFRSTEPNIDIRHGQNLTKSKWSLSDFRDKTTCVNWQEGKCPEWAEKLIT
jgi:hypothetical protein